MTILRSVSALFSSDQGQSRLQAASLWTPTAIESVGYERTDPRPSVSLF
jgi:hypothetical protein